MAKFELFYPLLRHNEAGYDIMPEDNGNWTGGKRGVGRLSGTIDGITAYEVSKYIGHEASPDEVKNFPESGKLYIYRNKYWNVIKGDEIKDQDIANSLADFDVNVGIKTGIKKLQVAAGLPETGVMDDLTLKTINNEI